MKTLILKENQALYEVVAQQEYAGEPIIIERDGQPLFVLVPYAEYEVLRALQQRQSEVIQSDWPEDRTLEEVVAGIKRLGPSRLVREPTTSLKNLLENSPHDPDFNLEEWTREWARIEAEMKAEEERDRLRTEAEMRAILGHE